MTTEKQRRAFISYSRVNKEFASKLAKGLRSVGYPVWFDLIDIPTGSRWDDEVEKALRECSIFLIILTPASIASENVKDEIGYAIDHDKHILPILLEECDIPLRLRRFQYVDFTKIKYDDGIKRVTQLLASERFAPAQNNDLQPLVATQKTVKKATGKKSFLPKGLVFSIGAVLIALIGLLIFQNKNSLIPPKNEGQVPTQLITKATPAPTRIITIPTKDAVIATATLRLVVFAQLMDVSRNELGFPADDDIGARFRATNDFANKIGFVGGFPNFYFNDQTINYGTILLTQSAAEWRDVPASELGYPVDSDIGARFRAVFDYAIAHEFVGGFPNFYSNDVTKSYGTILLRQGAAEWRDVPMSELGYPAQTDIGAMFRAVHNYTEAQGFVGGFPNFYSDDVKQVYGVILVKASP